MLLASQVGRTEKIQNCLNPKFAKKFLIDYHFEIVQKLKFGIYDIDNKTIDLNDDDFLGELECSLGQVRKICCLLLTSIGTSGPVLVQLPSHCPVISVHHVSVHVCVVM